ncbi:MAG: bile acid:sodium symporter family protein [Bacteroidaceae bacterium]|nr:bile acid:sodium symporter family protein [Bacteroidaceae bacterium]
MNTIFIVLPILTLLMFDLGLTLRVGDFGLVLKQPRAVIIALVGQIVLLPLLAFAVAVVFKLPPEFFVGMVLIGCCPGGSSSNVFSMLAKGDVALSVMLTALSSIITLFTVPLIMAWTTQWSMFNGQSVISLPVGNLLVQNLLLMFLPIVIGIAVRRCWPVAASKIERVLSKLAFPLLILLATIFFIQHRSTISDNIALLGLCVTLLLICATGGAALLSRLFKLGYRQRRTIVIEVGMQNAAQAIAIASSPFIFNNDTIAIPAIIYALMMNVVLLFYVGKIVVGKK